MPAPSDNEPKINVEDLRGGRESDSKGRRFAWRVQNLTDKPLQFLEAWCPHGKFRSDKKVFDPPVHVPAGEKATIEMAVFCDEPAGAVVENGFLILTAEWLNHRWRVFVRLLIVVDKNGVPETRTELISAQRVGFSGIP